MPTHHLLTVWNPSYAMDAMDAHLRVLLDWAERRDREEADPEDVYVWWAKLRSPRRAGDLPHADDVLALKDQITGGAETHLYLTDHRSLYVGQLLDITDRPVPEAWPDEVEHMPSYYERYDADFWFLLYDLRRLVHNDTPATVRELKKLRNVRYHDRPVSLYGGLVDLPLIVRREEDVRWFDDLENLTEGRRWAEREADFRGETERMSRELRDNLLGPEIWQALEPATRTFLASAEAVVRARRDDPGFDFSGPAVEYAKAVEVELNALIFPPLRRVFSGAPPDEREIRTSGRLLDLAGRVRHQTLGSIHHLLKHEKIVRGSLSKALGRDAAWVKDDFVRILEPLLDLRNPAAHEAVVPREGILEIRRDLLGIGCEGLVVKLATLRVEHG